MNDELTETLRLAQRLGFFGPGPIEAAVKHAAGFADALGHVAAGSRVVDLGSGGGLPGLVLADRFPECVVTLIDRRTKRTDFLERAVRRLGLTNTTVRAGDAERLVDEVQRGITPPFDAVTARGFGPPAVTLRIAQAVLAADGLVVISEPPSGDRWDPELLADLGLSGQAHGSVRVFRRFT
ncbi:MAG TPA: RsmG family class I SAM-dependent methyltransferase [Ilumatobacter sp.]|nr:RsmG family class I SAM-dependent methyltransferase [Ilumatobacter sp.]